MDAIWIEEAPRMRCISCKGSLEVAPEEALRCTSCQCLYPLRDGILDTGTIEEGDNKIVAEYYDSARWKKFKFWLRIMSWFFGGEQRMRRPIIDHLPPLKGTRLLVICIGEGRELRMLTPDCTLIGLDISRVQLRDCRVEAQGRKVGLILGPAEKIPYQDQAFDNVLCTGGFTHFSDALGSLHEMSRVTRPGGKIVVSDEVPELGAVPRHRPIRQRLMKRWFGDGLMDVMQRHSQMKLEPLVQQALDNWKIHSIWRGRGYCIVGEPKKAAQPAAATPS